LFEVFQPGKWVSEIERINFKEMINKMKNLLNGKYTTKIELMKIYDPVFDEEKF